eukprot:15363720-Ditylum_brightwellii.AAC.1
MDKEFEPLQDKILPTILNTTLETEHVSDTEQEIQAIKEIVRGVKCILSFKKIPKFIITKMVAFCIVWLNAFAPKSGVFSSFSPRAIVCGSNLSYKHHCKVPFGAYTHTHEENAPTNSMDNRIIGTILVGLSFNLQGGYKFLNLSIGKLIHQKNCTELSMLDSVVKKAKDMSTTEVKGGGIVFKNSTGAEITNI